MFRNDSAQSTSHCDKSICMYADKRFRFLFSLFDWLFPYVELILLYYECEREVFFFFNEYEKYNFFEWKWVKRKSLEMVNNWFVYFCLIHRAFVFFHTYHKMGIRYRTCLHLNSSGYFLFVCFFFSFFSFSLFCVYQIVCGNAKAWYILIH